MHELAHSPQGDLGYRGSLEVINRITPADQRSEVVSSYLLGVGYRPGDMRVAVTRADRGGVAQAALPVLLLCFHYDPATGRYTLAIMKLLRLAAGITVITMGGTLFLAFRRGRSGA